MVRKLMLSAALIGSLLVSACNTIAGAGRDIESVGDTIERTAQ